MPTETTKARPLPTKLYPPTELAEQIERHLEIEISKTSLERYMSAGRLDYRITKGVRCSSVAMYAAMVEGETAADRERRGLPTKQAATPTKEEWTARANQCHQALVGAGK